ncbi:peroxiredoxin [Humidesulfovibrio sp.]
MKNTTAPRFATPASSPAPGRAVRLPLFLALCLAICTSLALALGQTPVAFAQGEKMSQRAKAPTQSAAEAPAALAAPAARPAPFEPGPLKPLDSAIAVRPGDPAPNFALPAILPGQNGHGVVRLSDYRGKKNVMLSFVPAAFTPVCSDQWPGYHLAQELFDEHNTQVLGISVDNLPSLHAWGGQMFGLWFPMLSDFWPHGAVAKTYGVLRGDGTAERSLVIIDKTGVVRFAKSFDINTRPDLGLIMNELAKLPK